MKNKGDEKYLKLGLTGAAVAAFALLFYFLLANLGGIGKGLRFVGRILTPFVYGAVIAYIVLPLCRRLERAFRSLFKGKRDRLASSLAIVLSLVIILLIVFAVFLLVIPQLVASLQRLVRVLPSQLEAARAQLEALLESRPQWVEWIEQVTGDWFAQLEELLHSGLNDMTKLLMSSLGSRTAGLPALAQTIITGARGVAGVLGNLLVGTIVSIYLLARRRQLAAQAKLVLRGLLKPSWADWMERELRLADRMFNGFFMGKLLDSAIVGVLCFIGCVAMGFESPLLIAVIVGVTNVIPFFGPYIGAIPSALLLLLENPMHCLMFLIFLILLQQLDGNFIGPRILGNTTGLSGMWVMFAILLFGGLWGLTGMIVGVPLMAILYDVARQLTFFGVKRHGQGEMIERYNAEFHPPVQMMKRRGRK